MIFLNSVHRLPNTVTGVEYLVLSNQVILDHIMNFLSYKDVQRLSSCCRTLRELSTIEFERRKNGTTSNYVLFRSKNRTTSEPFFHHPKCDAKAVVHNGVEKTQQALSELINQLRFLPKIAIIFTGGKVNSQELRKWSKWFQHQLPTNCGFMNVLSKTAICGSIKERVYEVHQEKNDGTSGLAYLLLGTQRSNFCIELFKSLTELVSLTDGKTSRNEPVKCILYFSRAHSRKRLSKILSLCKERNENLSIAFGGLVLDSLASFVTDEYTSNSECAGLVFLGSNVMAASTIIEAMTNDQIRDSMIRFRESIPFDITDTTKNTICFLLSCIEHSPNVNYSSEYTESESDIFHTIFPSNVKTFGLSGHGEFGQVSGVMEEQNKIAHQFSCIMVFVQLPMK